MTKLLELSSESVPGYQAIKFNTRHYPSQLTKEKKNHQMMGINERLEF